MELLARGTTSGQPVACVSVESGESLESVRSEYFSRLSGDPSSIVAVLTPAPAPGVDVGLSFVAFDGPLGGCGEATMFAAAVWPASSVVFGTSSGPIAASGGPAGSGSGSVTLRMPVGRVQPTAEPSMRLVSVAGNTFAVVAAAAAGIGLDLPPEVIAQRGDALLRSVDGAGLLLLTTQVVAGVTRSAVVWGNAILNRGPCGTGTCARLLVALADGDLPEGDTLHHYSPFGHAFDATLTGGHITLSGQVTLSR